MGVPLIKKVIYSYLDRNDFDNSSVFKLFMVVVKNIPYRTFVVHSQYIVLIIVCLSSLPYSFSNVFNGNSILKNVLK